MRPSLRGVSRGQPVQKMHKLKTGLRTGEIAERGIFNDFPDVRKIADAGAASEPKTDFRQKHGRCSACGINGTGECRNRESGKIFPYFLTSGIWVGAMMPPHSGTAFAPSFADLIRRILPVSGCRSRPSLSRVGLPFLRWRHSPPWLRQASPRDLSWRIPICRA